MHRYSYPIQNFTINISFITGSQSPSMHFSPFTNIHVSNLTILEIHMIYWRWILADFDYSNATKVCSLCGTQEWKITTTKCDVVFEVHRATITTDWSATILKLVLKLVLQADSHHFGDEHVTYSYDLDCEKQWALELRQNPTQCISFWWDNALRGYRSFQFYFWPGIHIAGICGHSK